MALSALAIAGPVVSLFRTWMEGKVETTKENATAKIEMAKARTKNALALQINAQNGDIQWELIQADASRTSWKDEWLTLLFSIPLILAFCGDWGREVVTNGFKALELMPDWYIWALSIILGAAFGVKQGGKLVNWWVDRAGK